MSKEIYPIFNPIQEEKEINPALVQEVVHVLCYEMDEKQAAVFALRHIWDMDEPQIVNHTGFQDTEVRRLMREGGQFLFKRFVQAHKREGI